MILIKIGVDFWFYLYYYSDRGAAFVNKVIRKEEVMDDKSDSSKLELEYVIVKYKKKKKILGT